MIENEYLYYQTKALVFEPAIKVREDAVSRLPNPFILEEKGS
jgi:hypothetical protein